MRKKILWALALVMVLSCLSLVAGCGKSRSDEDEGIFVPASEEYTILDEGEKDNSATGKKSGKSNTNAKKASDTDKKQSTQKQDETAVTATPAPSASGAPSGNSGNSSGAEDESPFVPASGNGTSPKTVSGGDSGKIE